jgi:hypothetical protein
MFSPRWNNDFAYRHTADIALMPTNVRFRG